MKPSMRISVSVLVIVFLIALPYLFFFFQPSIWFAISSRVSRNAPVDASQQSTASASPGSEVPASSDVAPSAEVPASSDVDPSAEVQASAEVPASSNVAPSSEVQANSAVTPSPEASASSEAEPGLESVLQRASSANKTVIITTLNQAWATPGTMIDLFLESFRRGEDTKHLLNHLVVVALDQRSFQRCGELHEHCFMLRTPGVDFSGSKAFMSPDFLKMMWRRMRLLRHILELGYNFVFTGGDQSCPQPFPLPGRHVTVLIPHRPWGSNSAPLDCKSKAGCLDLCDLSDAIDRGVESEPFEGIVNLLDRSTMRILNGRGNLLTGKNEDRQLGYLIQKVTGTSR